MKRNRLKVEEKSLNADGKDTKRTRKGTINIVDIRVDIKKY